MDSQFTFASRDDLWRLENDMKAFYATQSEHTDRLLRLERRQDDDTRLKSVWGNSSPFPGTLNGTPQQGLCTPSSVYFHQLTEWASLESTYNPAAEAFKSFDQDQSSNLLGSLHLDTEEEPRRGASRANSVRFDESALHGHFAQGSRSSSDFFPLRTSSGLGSHPMTERSSSHKSEGRQSSTGLSTQSTRLNSLGIEIRQPNVSNAMALGPPPGLFLLGPLPSIIRCWLDTHFSNDSLLYAAICTGSVKSLLDFKLISRLGIQDRVTTTNGERKVKLQVYFPEATFQQQSSRSGSPAPQLPAITVDFFVKDMEGLSTSMQIFLGSDVLRSRNADVLFSQDRLSLLDDSRNKLAIPLVRPENPALYQDLCTLPSTTNVSKPTSLASSAYQISEADNSALNSHGPRLRVDTSQSLAKESVEAHAGRSLYDASSSNTPSTQVSTIGEERGSALSRTDNERKLSTRSIENGKGLDSLANGSTPDTPSKAETVSIWGPWRRESGQSTRQDPTFSNVASSSVYQKPTRGRGMKVLKPARSATSSRVAGTAQTISNFETSGVRSEENGAPAQFMESSPIGPPTRSLSNDSKPPLQSATNKTRSANPVGGASAFGWLNSNPQKQSSVSTD